MPKWVYKTLLVLIPGAFGAGYAAMFDPKYALAGLAVAYLVTGAVAGMAFCCFKLRNWP
jgi:hypothetical protein